MIDHRRSLSLPGLVLSGWLVGCNSGLLAVPQSPTSVSLPSSPLVTQAKSQKTMPTIPFQSLAQGESYTAQLENPALFVVSNAAEADRFTQLLNDPEIVQRIQSVDFNTTYVVAVFRGQVGSSGYGIAIGDITSAPGTVQLKVNLTDPPSDRAVSAVISYPYQLVSVSREKLSIAPETTWSVYDSEGKLLVQTKSP